MKCPKCNSDNPDTQQFCGKCGTKLVPAKDNPASATKSFETPRMELTTGSVFAGRYKIVEELGEGGMGKVYRVIDKQLNEEVALKLIKPEIASDKKTIKRFRNELKLSRKISHRNVGRMYELMEDKGSLFITMEYVSGQDLKGLIRQSGRLAIGTTISIAKQVCEGLTEAHRLGVIHRDLKPHNIMIDKRGNARIMDFGIARSLTGKSITRAGAMIGTPEYMSPEQVEGKEVDQRSDIYSLGINLYEMLTGKVPFEGDTPFTIGVKHKSETPKNLKELNAQIPENLNNIILRCLEKDKEKRYQNVKEILSEIKDIEVEKHVSMKFHEWKNSIAVLPFKNMSADPEQEYFCEGMAEEIINALTHIKDLRVVARTSAFSFKGKDEDIREIGRKLSVDKVLEGSVRKAGDRLRITAQLINIEDGYHLWSERYDRTMEDVFDIQDEISLAIVENLKAKLLKREKAALLKQPTEDLEAYNLYLKGRYFVSKITDESLLKAIDYFKEAIKRDSSFALAYSGIAESYVFISQWGGGVLPSKKSRSDAKEATLKAVELNPDIAETHTSLAMVATWFDWDRVVAGKSLKKAIELSPNSVDTLIWYARYLNLLEYKFEEAIKIYNRALELNPLQFLIFNFRGYAYMCNQQFDICLENAQKLLSLDPNYWYSYHLLGEAYLGKRLYREAIANYEEAIRHGGRTITNIAELGFAHALAGNTNKAMKLLEETEKVAHSSNSFYAYIGMIYVGLGNNDKAFEWFDRSCDERDPTLIVIPPTQWVNFGILRKDLRFKALLKKMGLTHLTQKK